MKNVLIICTLLLLSCSKSDTNSEVKIRLSNNSELKFIDATFNGLNFGDLEPNEKSEFKVFERAYHYGSASISIDGENYGWIPIDFVGETPLKKGDYTFEYYFNQETKILTDKLITE